MNDDCLKLTVYYGERALADDRFVADALVDIFARHQLHTSLVMRGIAGFGAKQHLRTDRLLTLSEHLRSSRSLSTPASTSRPPSPKSTRCASTVW